MGDGFADDADGPRGAAQVRRSYFFNRMMKTDSAFRSDPLRPAVAKEKSSQVLSF